MADKLSDLSIADLRRRYAGPDARVSSQVLSRLRRDPRQGVRQLYQVLKRREERRRQEEQRLDAMLNFERVLWKTGTRRVAGVDEAGVGPLAGFRGANGDKSGRGEVNPRQLEQYIENGGFFVEHIFGDAAQSFRGRFLQLTHDCLS